jgi:galactokinase
LRAAVQAAETFSRLHRREPHGVWSAPGRVNLIGAHTDYNEGLVLPFALPQRTAVAAAPRIDGMLAVTTVGDDGRAQRAQPMRVAALEPGGLHGWVAYPAGVSWVLREHGIDTVTAGADLVISGEVPAGAGLSSSAALECAVTLALLGIAGHEVESAVGGGKPERAEVARWAQQAENDFVGAPTGMLDQMASMCCIHSHALFLDVRSGDAEQVPFDTANEGLQILVIDTRASHSHAESGYGQRRRSCERAVELLGVAALRDIAQSGLDAALAALPGELRPLVRHVITENERVLRVVDLLRANRLHEVGPWLTASHDSLRDDYQVSAPELDVAVEAALGAGALGARMTGGGFGGSVIALVENGRRAAVEHAVTTAFHSRSCTTPRLFTAAPAAGAGRDR